MPLLLTIAKLLGINVPRLTAYAAVVALVVGGYFAVRQHFINVGRAQVVNEIASNNRETLQDVDSAKSKVDDCRLRGGVWSTIDGVCE